LGNRFAGKLVNSDTHSEAGLFFELKPDKGGNWWGWLPLLIVDWVCVVVVLVWPFDPEKFPLDARIGGAGGRHTRGIWY